eukprot:TRINITY_DN82230_c0_g1_i7.p2 TRINITY_DN82230_c0_g1~~TRINITY_DN82230_c0_g1_i7.p2  ORF type:complete len:110 (+),score=22.19 TRINITY_DN82230_c0_g1_i7:90-419(+)
MLLFTAILSSSQNQSRELRVLHYSMLLFTAILSSSQNQSRELRVLHYSMLLFTAILSSSQNQSRELRVLHYEAWTGQVADNVPDLLRLLDTLHTSHAQSTTEPIVIQCM